ncbi:MAG TPA: HTH domain-containing protein [Anaeromyxobacteraceae bacterium]|jgi:hypothetical protein|nr:HTH domain-containing protein [Anaeromyxobacteraceae bacterium]
MTFTEAAIEVLRREGKPLHFKKIAEIAIRENLLDHVGKIPEEILGGQLVTHCKLPKADRRVIAVQPGTFALVEWGLDEDPRGLDGMIEPPPENDLPYRPRERHPVPSKDMARTVGRGESGRGRRREEGEERRRRFPPPAEVAYELLAGSGRSLSLAEIAALGAERALMPDAFVRDAAALQAALLEDNRRRESGGRKPLFALEGEQVSLLAQPEPGERAAPQAATPATRLAASPAELRRAGLQALRRKLRESDAATAEHLCAKLLEQSGLRELKVAKRGRDHVVYTARRRMGLADVRHCVRVIRGGTDVSRRDLTEMRRDLGHYGAQIGVVLSAGEAAREARGEASAAGQSPVLLLCGEALAEAFADAGIGCTQVVVPEVDEAFFKAAAEAAALEEAARRARREERDRREGREPREGERREPREGREPRESERREPRERPAPAPVAPESAPGEERAPQPPLAEIAPVIPEVSLEKAPEPPEADEGDDDDGADEDEGSEPAEAAGSPGQPGAERPAAEGEGRRRRRRRRRRGGRGRGRGEGPQSAPGEGDAAAPAEASSSGASAQPAPAAAPPKGEGGEG